MRYIAGFLHDEAEGLGARLWTILPVAKDQVAFAPIDDRIVYWVCRILAENPDMISILQRK